MKGFHKVTSIVLAAILASYCLSQITAAAQDLSGRQIMEKQKELQRLQDEEEVLDMQLIDSKGRTKERKIIRYTMKTPEDLDKLLIKFTYPPDVKGTALLTWEHQNQDDDQWLYPPALRKEKRIASSGKKNKFMGTDFAYEDLRSEKLDVHEYNLLGTETSEGDEYFVVEALPATEKEKRESGYSKRKLWVKKDIFFTLKIEYFDKGGNLAKIQSNSELKNVGGGTYRADTTKMDNLQEKHQTVLTVKGRKANQGLEESLFTIRMLKR